MYCGTIVFDVLVDEDVTLEESYREPDAAFDLLNNTTIYPNPLNNTVNGQKISHR